MLQASGFGSDISGAASKAGDKAEGAAQKVRSIDHRMFPVQAGKSFLCRGDCCSASVQATPMGLVHVFPSGCEGRRKVRGKEESNIKDAYNYVGGGDQLQHQSHRGLGRPVDCNTCCTYKLT